MYACASVCKLLATGADLQKYNCKANFILSLYTSVFIDKVRTI